MDDQQKELVSTARAAGIWYLVLAIAGVLGFLVLHPQVYIAEQIEQTVTNLQEQETLARWRLLSELVIILSQALAAVYFFKLFKEINHFAAWCLAAWGMMNAAAIMMSAVAMGGAIQIANTDLPLNDKLVMVQIFVQIIKNAWGVGGLFFGLWLIPMGYIVISSQRMPVWLGHTLMLGSAGYIASAFLNYAGLEYSWIDLLTIPASIGEFWMIGYLLTVGIRLPK